MTFVTNKLAAPRDFSITAEFLVNHSQNLLNKQPLYQWSVIYYTVPTGPSRATVGPRKTLLQGPITHHPPHYVCLEIETPKASRGRKREERCPLTIRLGVRRPKMDFMHILGQKEATWNIILSIFEQRRGSPNVAGPGKTFPPFSPCRRACVPMCVCIVQKATLGDGLYYQSQAQFFS